MIEIAFDTVSRTYQALVVGSLKHEAALGTDEAGCITRIDNAIARINESLEFATQSLSDTERQIDNAKAEAAKPFAKEDELTAKTMRLSELDKALDMDKSDDVELCDEGRTSEAQRKEQELER